MEKEISACLLKLRRRHPFLATLSLHMDYVFTDEVSGLQTDGRKTRINGEYFRRLNSEQRVSSLAHVTLHCALLHAQRCGFRDPGLWNIAADIVVNGILAESQLPPPPSTAVEPRYANLSVEQVFRKLEQDASQLQQQAQLCGHTATGHPSAAAEGDACNQAGEDAMAGERDSHTGRESGNENSRESRLAAVMQQLYPAMQDLGRDAGSDQPQTRQKQASIEKYWKQALVKARTVAEMHQKYRGDLPAGLLREIDCVVNPKMDWRTRLWRFMAKTPCDYAGFDRRFVHQGLYLENLEGESLNVYVAIDTSGSISDEELDQFRAEVEAIANCYGLIKVYFYFVDAEVHGPYELDHCQSIETAIGSGGTRFDVFFNQLEMDVSLVDANLCIYFTDGLGEFPETPPHMPVLWVVTADGNASVPFGDVARMQ